MVDQATRTIVRCPEAVIYGHIWLLSTGYSLDEHSGESVRDRRSKLAFVHDCGTLNLDSKSSQWLTQIPRRSDAPLNSPFCGGPEAPGISIISVQAMVSPNARKKCNRGPIAGLALVRGNYHCAHLVSKMANCAGRYCKLL